MDIITQEAIMRAINYLNYHGPIFISGEFQDTITSDIPVNEKSN